MKGEPEKRLLMKKKLIIVIILLIALISIIYSIILKTQSNSNVTVEEIEKIEEYISKIYMWKEVTKEALPEFEDINNASSNWLWEEDKKNKEDYEFTYEQINKKAKELFGENFTTEFPTEGTDSMKYDEDKKVYVATQINLDEEDDTFLLDKIEKINNGYEVDIIEYLEDYSQMQNLNENTQEETYIIIKNLQGEVIDKVNSSESENKIIEKVKENKEKFSKKKIILNKDKNGNITVKQIKK